MPKNRIHCAFSRERIGYNFKELHKWIDKDEKGLGVNHRKKRHAYNTNDEKTIKDYWDKKKGKGWGDKAVVEWLFHIAVDNLETAYKRAKKCYRKNNVYNYFKFGMLDDSSYIFCDYGNMNKEEIKEEFREHDYEEDNNKRYNHKR